MLAVWRTSRVLAVQSRLSFRDSIVDTSDAIPPQTNTPFEVATPGLPPLNTITRERSASLASMPLVSPNEEKGGGTKRATLKKRRKLTRRYTSKNKRARVAMSGWIDQLKEKLLDLFTTSRSLHLAALKPRLELFREVMCDEVGPDDGLPNISDSIYAQMGYTAVLAAASVLSAVATLLASWNRMLLSQDQWLTFQSWFPSNRCWSQTDLFEQ